MTEYINIRINSGITFEKLALATRYIGCEMRLDADGMRIDPREIKTRQKKGGKSKLDPPFEETL